MPASVVVVLKNRSPYAARSRSLQVSPSKKLSRILKEHDAVILPDATTATGMVVSVPDMARANRLAAALRKLDEVETAYAKPGEELP